ncbi:ABC transporter substrate-binding protein [Candidatus Leptofilum sp.]|uniref:ABC transporter substrate-binding protein n=1 Tax=Candidatus Leptofilum sp. TaxID=3241576 RepID=UPI003B5C272D
MKKFSLLLISLLLFGMLLVACGGGDDETPAEEDTTTEDSTVAEDSGDEEMAEEDSEEAMAEEELPYGLTPGKPYDGTEINFLICCPTTAQFVAWSERAEMFTEMTGITVNFANEPWGSFQERIVTESIAGTGAYDAVVWLDVWGPAFIQTLEPLEPYIERDGIDYADDYPPSFMQAAVLDGTQYGFPVRTHAFVLHYREDVFEELGLEPPTTWNEMIEVGRTIQENTDLAGHANYYGVGTAQNLFIWALQLWGNGGDIFDEDFRPIFNNAAGVEATELYASMAEIGPEAQFSIGEGDARLSVTTGESAMIIGWWWFAPTFNDPEAAAEEVVGNVGHAPVPAVEGSEPVSFALSIPVGISSFSQNKDAAWEWVKFLSHPQSDLEVVTDKSRPEVNTVVVSHSSNLVNPEVNEVNGGLHESAAPGLANSRIMPLIPEWAEVASILEVAINDIALGADVQETLDEAASDVEGVMERAGYYE